MLIYRVFGLEWILSWAYGGLLCLLVRFWKNDNWIVENAFQKKKNSEMETMLVEKLVRRLHRKGHYHIIFSPWLDLHLICLQDYSKIGTHKASRVPSFLLLQLLCFSSSFHKTFLLLQLLCFSSSFHKTFLFKGPIYFILFYFFY